jgi:hypothetical protein
MASTSGSNKKPFFKHTPYREKMIQSTKLTHEDKITHLNGPAAFHKGLVLL